MADDLNAYEVFIFKIFINYFLTTVNHGNWNLEMLESKLKREFLFSYLQIYIFIFFYVPNHWEDLEAVTSIASSAQILISK